MKSIQVLLITALLGAVLLGGALGGCAGKDDGKSENNSQVTPPPNAVGKGSPAEQKARSVQTHISAGIEALKQRDPERSRRHISRALELEPKSPEANNAMALLYHYEGDDAREEEYYKRAIRSDGNFSQARNNYASFLYRQGRYAEAIKHLEFATEDTAYDQRGMAFLNLGRCYAKIGELDKAEAALQRAQRLERQRSEILVEMADVALAQKKYAEAEKYLAAFQEQNRNTSRSLWVGIRLAAATGYSDRQASYEFQLAKLFRESQEYSEWQAWRAGTAAPATSPGKKAR